jgi:hypothetical protein
MRKKKKKGERKKEGRGRRDGPAHQAGSPYILRLGLLPSHCRRSSTSQLVHITTSLLPQARRRSPESQRCRSPELCTAAPPSSALPRVLRRRSPEFGTPPSSASPLHRAQYSPEFCAADPAPQSLLGFFPLPSCLSC